jgi:hypothetical protein
MGRGTTNPGLLICPPNDSPAVWRSLRELNERVMATGSYVTEPHSLLGGKIPDGVIRYLSSLSIMAIYFVTGKGK